MGELAAPFDCRIELVDGERRCGECVMGWVGGDPDGDCVGNAWPGCSRVVVVGEDSVVSTDDDVEKYADVGVTIAGVVLWLDGNWV